MQKILKKSGLLVIALAIAFSMLMPMSTEAATKQKSVNITCISNNTTVNAGTTTSLNVKTDTVSSISYKTSNKKVATVKNGKIVTYKEGTVTIKITAKPKSKLYKTTTKSIKIKVTQKPVSITCISTNTTVGIDSKTSLNVKTNTKSSISYSTSNKSVAAIKSGKLVAYKPGTVTIKITAKPSSKAYKTTTKSIKITVAPATTTTYITTNGNTIKISAKSMKKATEYQFQYATNASMSKATNKTTSYKGFSITGSAGNTYYIRCRAITKSGKTRYYGDWSKIVTVTFNPSTPTVSMSRNDKAITINAGTVNGATEYEFQYATNTSMSNATIKYTSSREFKFNGIADTTYYARIKAIKTIAGKKYYSSWSKIVSMTIPKDSEPEKPPVETETKAPETETQPVETETKTPETETQPVETETETPETQKPACQHDWIAVTKTETITIPASEKKIVDKEAWTERVPILTYFPERDKFFWDDYVNNKIPCHIGCASNDPDVIKFIKEDFSNCSIVIDYFPTLDWNDASTIRAYEKYLRTVYLPSDFGMTWDDFLNDPQLSDYAWGYIDESGAGYRLNVYNSTSSAIYNVPHPEQYHMVTIPASTTTQEVITGYECSKCHETKAK